MHTLSCLYLLAYTCVTHGIRSPLVLGARETPSARKSSRDESRQPDVSVILMIASRARRKPSKDGINPLGLGVGVPVPSELPGQLSLLVNMASSPTNSIYKVIESGILYYERRRKWCMVCSSVI